MNNKTTHHAINIPFLAKGLSKMTDKQLHAACTRALDAATSEELEALESWARNALEDGTRNARLAALKQLWHIQLEIRVRRVAIAHGYVRDWQLALVGLGYAEAFVTRYTLPREQHNQGLKPQLLPQWQVDALIQGAFEINRLERDVNSVDRDEATRKGMPAEARAKRAEKSARDRAIRAAMKQPKGSKPALVSSR